MCHRETVYLLRCALRAYSQRSVPGPDASGRTILAWLRHTLASQFIMNSGNILMLQKFLRPMALAMTMLYAHLLPDHLKDAVRFGPASDFRHFFDS